MTKRTRRGIASSVLVVVALVFGAVIVTALRAEGRERTETRTNDGGAWLLKRDEGYVGHVNHAVKELTAAVNVASAGADFDVDQGEGIIAVQDRTAGTVVVVEDATQLKGTTVQMPAEVVADAVDGGVLLVNESSLTVHQLSRDEFIGLEESGGLENTTPVIQGEGAGRAASFTDGHAVVVDQAGGQVVFLDPDGGTRRSPSTELTDVIVSITAVGTDRAVLVDSDGDVFVATPDEIRLLETGITSATGESAPLVLQQPSVAADHVVAASLDGSVHAIPLEPAGNEGATELAALPGGSPLAPIVYKGCLFAVVTNPPTFLQQCGDEFSEVKPLDGAGSELRLREVNGWIWINDVTSGAAWVTEPERRLDQIEDWGAILSSLSDDRNDDDNQADESDEVETVVDPDDPTAEIVQSDEFDEAAENVPPVANDDEASTRVERPVEVDVLANDTDANRDPLLITSVDHTGGDAVVSMSSDGASVQVTPSVSFSGLVTFDYSISDGRSEPVSASATVQVVPADSSSNQPPEPQNDIASTRRGRPTTFDVLENDRDPDGDALVLESVELADPTTTAGTIVANPSGQVVFTPDPNTRTDRIELEYTVSDDYGATATASVVVDVRLQDSNNEPDARNDAARTVVDKPVRIDVLHNDTDPDRDPLFVNAQPILTSPTDLTSDALDVSLTADGEFFFNPERSGTFVFEYSVSDGDEVDTARIRVDVEEPVENRPPVALRDDVVIPAGGTRLVNVLDNDGDPDGDIVSIAGNTTADGVTVKEVDGVGFLVSVAADAPARSVFQYSITDGRWPDPITATVVVAVTGSGVLDQPPIANDDVAEVRAGSRVPVNVLDNDSDPENGVLRVTNVTTAEAVTAAPGLNGQTVSVDVGADVVSSFTLSYTVADEAGNQANALIQVRIIPPDDANRAPIARADVARTQSGTPIVIDVRGNDKDPDGDLFVLEAVSAQPGGGQAVVTDGTIRYTPAETFAGTDRFAYSIVDSNGAVAIGDVLVGVVPRPSQNRAPEAFDDQIAVIADSAPIVIDVLANDSDSDRDPLSLTTVGMPPAGSAAIGEGGTVVFSPPDSTGTPDGSPLELTVPYSIADGRGGTASANIAITVTTAGAPVAPEAVDDLRGPLTPGETIEIDVLANDVDPDGNPAELTVASDDPALARISDGVVTYTAGETSGRHRYTVTDADGLSATGEVAVLVVDNRAPEVTPISIEMTGDEVRTIDIAAAAAVTDPDGDSLFYACCESPVGGATSLEVTGGDGLVVTFDPDDAFSGPASFSYTVDDQRGHTVSGSVAIEVTAPANRPPEAQPGRFDVEAGTPTPIDLGALVTDPDGAEGLTFALGQPDNGTVQITADGATATATADIGGAGGTTTVPYTVTDDGGESASSELTLTVTLPDAPPPTAVADTTSTNQETPVTVNVLGNDVDPLGQGLTIVTAAGGSSGTATIAGSGITFAPNPSFFGTATVTYTIRDAANSPERESTAQLVVDVIGRPGAPGAPFAVAGNASAVVNWNAPQSNGAGIDEYAIRIGGSGDGTSVGAVTSYAYRGLDNGVEVSFSVRAHNSAGWGEWSPPSPGVIPDIEPARPPAPTVTFADSALIVNWSPPPDNGGSAITGYDLRIGGALSRVVSLGTGTTYRWDGLTNGAEYTFQVAAKNQQGSGEWSSQSAPEHPLRAPDAPSAPVGQRGDRYIDLSWQPTGNGGDVITNYQIQREGGGDVAATTSLRYRWSNLPNGQAQSFRVRANNRGGWGPWSAVSNAVVPCGVPQQPGNVQAVRGDRRATVSWAAADPNGCQVTNYRLTNDAGQSITVGGGRTSAAFTGLTNGTTYTFRVTASNEVGAGAASAASNAVIPAGPPAATNVTAARPGVRQVIVQWDRPDPNGDPITGYELQVNGGTWQGVGTAQSHTVTGLQSGREYTFRVRARNSVGVGTAGNAGSATTWGEPNQVGGLSVSGGDRRVRATWSTPNGNGAGVDRFEVDLIPGGSDTVQGTSKTFTGLAQDTRYEIRVRACNEVGCGPWSATKSARTDAPPPPQVSVSWSKGGSAQGQPGCNTSHCRWINASATGLTPGATYDVSCMSDGSQSGTPGEIGSPDRVQANSAGELSASGICYFGWPEESFWVTVGSHRSTPRTFG